MLDAVFGDYMPAAFGVKSLSFSPVLNFKYL